MKDDRKNPEAAEIKGLRIRTISAVVIALTAVLLLLFLRSTDQTGRAYEQLNASAEKFVVSELAADRLKEASDDLTAQVRMFSITRARKYMRRYFTEAAVSHRREDAVNTLERFLAGTDAHRYLERALDCSNELMEREYYSMRLVMEAMGYPSEENMQAMEGVVLTPEDAGLSREEKLEKAVSLVHDEIYQEYHERIDENVNACIRALNEQRQQAQEENTALLADLLVQQRILAGLLAGAVVLTVLTTLRLVILPLNAGAARITAYEPLPLTGAFELQYMARAYNIMYEENQRSSAHLRHEAEHDALTGLYNRGAFDKLRLACLGRPAALMLIDVDKFKEVNDRFGHEAGDRVLQKVAGLLSHGFRTADDYPCRVGGDEFAVIMTEVTAGERELIREKLSHVREGLQDGSDGLPRVTLSIGVAFGGPGREPGEVYKNADRALYQVKENGRDGCAFYGEAYAPKERAGEV